MIKRQQKAEKKVLCIATWHSFPSLIYNNFDPSCEILLAILAQLLSFVLTRAFSTYVSTLTFAVNYVSVPLLQCPASPLCLPY